jgi:HD-like signal output (HDOD) protein
MPIAPRTAPSPKPPPAAASTPATPASPPSTPAPAPLPLTVEQVISQLDAIATLPEVTAKISAVIKDPDSSASDLTEVMSHDPALVARVMQVINSALYARPTPIETLERAVVLLGFDGMQKIALAASLGALFKGTKLCTGFTAKDLWKHCIGVAVAARDIACSAKLPIREEAFLAGMTHDLGCLAALQVMPEELRKVCEAAGKPDAPPLIELERQAWGFDHQQLGGALAAHWNLPIYCQLIAAHHHEPETAPEDVRQLAVLIYVADTLCCQERIGFDRTACRQSLGAVSLSAAGIHEPLIEETREKLSALAWSAVTILG